MKIVIDATTTQDQFANRGPGRYTQEVVSNMVKQSHDNSRDDIYYLLTFNSPTTIESTIRDYPDIIRTINIGPCRASDKLNFVWWLRQYRPAIDALLREEIPDVYFCPYFWRGFPLRKTKTVVMIHDLAFPILNRYSSAPKYLDWIRKFQYHNALRRVAKADRVITNSIKTKEDLLKYVKIPKEKVLPVYLGISDRFRKVEPDMDVLLKYLPKEVIKTGYIMYYSGVEKNKNVPGLIKAYAALRKMYKSQSEKYPPYLVLAGGDFTRLDMRNTFLAEVRYLIADLGLEEYVYFTGFFEDEDLNDLICGCSVFTHLSLYEGFGFAPLEAMRCGAPVVASNRSCYPEVLGDGALLVDPEDTEAVAQAYYKVTTDDTFAQELGESGMIRSEGYTWENTAAQTYKILEQVAANGKRKKL
ncbi:glycosyltransferase family 4 protein [Candidatus Dojkabacteria bacterium]|nr:glycosyltransferase family 4 protein [Candidatus Dojkabacteria bacterium]